MLNALKAAVIYFAVVFAVGFVLGAIRVMIVAPQLGEAIATLIELPLMLIASWFVCTWTVRRFAVSPALGPRLVMGLLAFGLLIAAEMILGTVGFGRTLSEQIQAYCTFGPLLGLMAQIVFAVFPMIQGLKSR